MPRSNRALLLRHYRHPSHASRAINMLHRLWPGHSFSPVSSPFSGYAFMYLIRVVTPDGRRAWVGNGLLSRQATIDRA